MNRQDKVVANITVAIIVFITLTVTYMYMRPSNTEVKEEKKEVLICGTGRLQSYVDNWRVEKNYVIDLTHGGIHETWHCRAFRGEANVSTGIGRD